MLVPSLLFMSGGMSSCNEDSKDYGDDIVVTVSNVAVNSFYLKADSKVMNKLDSVFFSIDLNKGVIFNADSLPRGTKITKLIPVISFSSTLSEASIKFTDADGKETTVDYMKNPGDSIDFTRDVKLDVTAADGTNKFSYTIRVNVHKSVPDSIMWSKLEMTALPSRLSDPVEQKTVEKGDDAYSLIKESDGSFTMSKAGSLADGTWEKTELDLGFEPDVRSLAATPGKFWILDADGNLYQSDDALTWTGTGEKWVTLIGPYLDCVLGVKVDGDGMRHCHYPSSVAISDPEMDPSFPIYGRSAFKTIESKWTDEPTAFFVGGETASGEVSHSTWAFDGTTWTTIDSRSTPAIKGAALFEYVIYRRTQSSFKQIAYRAWMIVGGELENGDYNRRTYLSFDNGVTWTAGSDLMTLPKKFPDLSGADAVVQLSRLDASLEDGWTFSQPKGVRSGVKLPYELDGYEITWACPYIYIIGGTTGAGRLSDTIWKGVLTRFTYTPII